MPVNEYIYTVPSTDTSNAWVNNDNTFGYVGLDGTSFRAFRENGGCMVNKKPVTETFFVLKINHRANPIDAEYAYTMLPNATVAQTQKFAKNPTVEILAHTKAVHAVRDTETGIIGINAFEANHSVCGVTVKQPCSLILNGDTVYVSDPTQTLAELCLEFDEISGIELIPKSNPDESPDEIVLNGNTVTVMMPIHGRTYGFRVIK